MATASKSEGMKSGDAAILERARKRWIEGYDAEKKNRERGIKSLRFKTGDQWDEEVKTARGNRPMLTINKLPQFVRRVVNEQRQSRPGIKIRGAGGGADNEIARTYEGLIRNIENQSDFETICDDGLEKTVDCGFAAWRILTDFEDDMSFDQECKIDRIKNQYNVIVDPSAQKFDKSDKKWTLIGETIRWEDGKAEYGDKLTYSEFSSMPEGAKYEGWYMEDKIRIAEYFELVPTTKQIAMLSDGKVIDAPKKIEGEKVDPDEYFQAYADNKGLRVIRTRKAETHKVMWYKLTGHDILDRRELKGRFIPVITCYGDVTVVDGEEVVNGLIEFAKDPMRMYNYFSTAQVEGLGLQNKSPYVAAAEQIADYRNDWRTANTSNKAVLRYKHIQGVPPPKRQEPPAASTGFAQIGAQMSGDLNETMGIYPPSLGQKSNETSGVAIAQRQQQGEIGTFHYVDNLNRAIKLTGKILIDLIPHIYDAPRVVRILGEDGADEMVPINQEHPTKKDEQGEPLVVDLSRGKYDLVVQAGPSFTTKREEMANLLIEITKGNPQLMQILGDKLFGSLDTHGAEEIAERMKKLVPPELLGQDEVGAQNNQGLPVGPQPGAPAAAPNLAVGAVQ